MSLRNYITPEIVINQLKMIRDDYHDLIILIEGESDKKFFSTFLDNKYFYFYVCNGWENVYILMQYANENGEHGFCGIIDTDYHKLLKDEISQCKNLFLTDENDLETMLFFSPSFEKFIAVCCNAKKIEDLNVRELILNCAQPVGALRFLSLRDNINLCFDKMDYRAFINKQTLSLSIESLVSHISSRSQSKGVKIELSNEAISDQICTIIKDYSPRELCNGHDIFEIVCIAMQKFLASSNAKEHNCETLFRHLLLAYTKEFLCETNLYTSIITWSKKERNRNQA